MLTIVADESISVLETHHFMTAKKGISLVADHDCVALLTDAWAGDLQHEGLVFRPLNDDLLLLRTVLLIRTDNASRLVNNFCQDISSAVQAERASARVRLGCRGA